MQVVTIYSPEELRCIAPMMKTEAGRYAVSNFATVWSAQRRRIPGASIPIEVTLEIGKNARLFRTKESTGERVCFGDVRLHAARDFVVDLLDPDRDLPGERD